MPPTIGDYHRAAIESAKEEIQSTPDDRVIGMDTDAWVEYLTAKFGMVEIVLDESRDVQMHETEREFRTRGYDIYTDRRPGTVVRETAIRIQVPVVPTDTVQAIWQHKLSPNSFSLTHPYPPFEYHSGVFEHEVNADQNEVTRGIAFIKETVRSYNVSIRDESPQFRSQIAGLAQQKLEQVQQKHKKLDDLAAAVGIPLRKKADPSDIVPAAPKVRAIIAPALPPPSKKPERPVLEASVFAAILDLLDNSGRQFERTPQAFRQLTEEGLRDILLSGLNAVYEGAAGGETFQGVGKVDIHLRIAQGEVFLAELKFWDGAGTLKEVIGQLRNRLTWRDAYGIAIVLSRNAGFTEVLKSVNETIPVCERGQDRNVSPQTMDWSLIKLATNLPHRGFHDWNPEN